MSVTSESRSPLDAAALQEAAGPDWTVQLHASAGSTNALAAAAPARNLVVVAGHQTAGRGRLDRTWETPAGAALTFSAVVDPQLEPEWWPLIPLAAGYAVARALGDRARLKWPNDVLIDDEKVSGILVERVGAAPAYAVIGIGINVDQTRAELPVPQATSLALAGMAADRTELLGEVLGSLRGTLGWLLRTPHGFMDSYRGLSATLDRDVRADLPDGSTLEGRVADIDQHGRLVVESRGGRAVVGAGDVVHVRSQR